MSREERILRRLHALARYGFNLEFSTYDLMLETVESDERLTEWYGEPVGGYAQDELDAIDLLAGAKANG